MPFSDHHFPLHPNFLIALISIHAYDGSMQKLQILFPDPLMQKMRRVAGEVDLPVSEVVRRATEQWLERFPDDPQKKKAVPVIDAGRCLVSAADMREAIYEQS